MSKKAPPKASGKNLRNGCLGLIVLLGLCGLVVTFANPGQEAATRSEVGVVNLATEDPRVAPTVADTPAQSAPTEAVANAAAPTYTPQPNQPPPTETPAPAPTAAPGAPAAVANANLRSGPGQDYAVVGGVQPGQPLALSGQVADGSWLQLAGGTWISAELVSAAPAGLPVVQPPALPTAVQPVEQAIAVPTSPAPPADANSQAFTCIAGCDVAPDPSCAIKGNVNSNGESIYHMPGWRDYNRTNVKPEEGDRWFCHEQEALDAGFRAPQNQ